MSMKERIYNAFRSTTVLLPPTGADMTRWSVIACDQFTSEPEYWNGIEDLVRDAPSALHCILPEAFLSDATPSKVAEINDSMRNYLYNYLEAVPYGMIYVERTLADGRVRRGIVGAVDLEEYDYRENTDVLVRATEATVVERIPARVRIRSGACIELPHSMLLIDDAENTVVEHVKHVETPLYDFELSGGGGHVKGYGIDKDECERIRHSLSELSHGRDEGLFFAVGDGNHSLASAKTWWEHLKANLPEDEKKTHPARYALTELVNLYDDSLDFEPIYRLVEGCEPAALISELCDFAGIDRGTGRKQSVTYVTVNGEGRIDFSSAPHSLTVGSLGLFLDAYAASHPEIKIDYIHGEDSLRRLVDTDHEIGFIFDGMKKTELFGAVEENGVLPRKAFSMGHATDKRYYVEARRIKNDGELSV